MAGFLLLGIILLVLSLRKKTNKILLFLIFSVLFVLSAFRDFSIGTDTEGYLMLFERLKYGIDIRQEPLWQLLNKLIIYMGGDFEALLMASAFLILFPIFYVSKKYSVNPILSIFFYYTLYFYFASMNITRQTVAVSFVLLAMMFLYEKKKKWFFIFVFIAAGFHTSAIAAIILYFHNRLPKKKEGFYLVIAGVTIFIGIFVSDFIFGLAGRLFGYERYVENYELGTFTGNFFYLLILNVFLYFIMKINDNRGYLFKMFFIFIILTNLTIRIPFGDRFILYFAIIQIIYLPYLMYNNKLDIKPFVSVVIIMYAFTMFFRKFGAGEIVPYINTLF